MQEASDNRPSSAGGSQQRQQQQDEQDKHRQEEQDRHATQIESESTNGNAKTTHATSTINGDPIHHPDHMDSGAEPNAPALGPVEAAATVTATAEAESTATIDGNGGLNASEGDGEAPLVAEDTALPVGGVPAAVPIAHSPASNLDMTEHALEVDDDNDDNDEYAEPTASIYAASHYPAVPIRYRVERVDSATITSSSRSLYVEDLDYVVENGRRYCGDYVFPNDDLEQDRLRLVHQVFLHLFNFELTSVPLDNPRYILDCGAGTGEWAIGMAEAFPSCEVVGVDISAIQPTAVPHNVFFEVDDCELDWMRPENTVDLVHLRAMSGAFADWDFIYHEAFTCLRPGGYIEVLDFQDHTSDADVLLRCFPPDARIHVLVRAVEEASVKAGRRCGTQHMDPTKLHRAGFVDVRVVEHSIPLNPLNPLNDSVAKLWLVACLHAVEAGSLRLLTKYMGWAPSEALALCDDVCQEIKARALNPATQGSMAVSLCVLTAQKPTPAANLLSTAGDDSNSQATAVLQAENGRAPSGSGDGSTITA
ncbi:methyltransferase type 12 [Niveomyces insectorum RCEF 264]|uniref:Methyltransferase type 12 n=1 Tax=Niveomyces insectorum RCEF 264 TaxID=1081102 RepID=A0A167WTF7_9HYPO|nr:methyltransferase type 12 [Niveomyces insectorum RCEF 264]